VRWFLIETGAVGNVTTVTLDIEGQRAVRRSRGGQGGEPEPSRLSGGRHFLTRPIAQSRQMSKTRLVSEL
jgi:hypothetical protein